MTSMLYTGCANTKPNNPEEFSLRTDTKVNYWFFIAVVVGLANAILFHPMGPPLDGVLRENFLTWPLGIRLIIELIPLLAGLLWARNWARFIRGLDELPRRVTIEAWLIAVLATIGFLSNWPLLDAAGISGSVYYATHFHGEFMDKPPSIFRTLLLFYSFYILGYFILIRRYK